MDIVYICRNGDNEELRYSIRSAVKNLQFDNLWVVGGKPDWYTGNHVRINNDRTKYVNARNNLMSICDNKQISESFILMNDDFYIVKKTKSIPYMYDGLLNDKIARYRDLNSYTKLLMSTWNTLQKNGVSDILNYELHVPMIMEKKKLKKVLALPGLWRSLYGNLYGVGGIEMTDVKVYSPGIRNQKSYDIDNLKYNYISSDDDSFEIIKTKILEKKFSKPSMYESIY